MQAASSKTKLGFCKVEFRELLMSDSKKRPAKKTPPRRKIPQVIQTHVLFKCRRRCALCYGLDQNAEEYEGQLAHINHNRSDCREDNLVFLCLKHHDRYDAKSHQSQGFKPNEVAIYKRRLEDYMEYVGKHGECKAEITITADFDSFTDEKKVAFVEALKSILRSGSSIVVLGKHRGSVKLVVSLDASDLAYLMRALDSGQLSALSIRSVEPLNRTNDKKVAFGSSFGILPTFSKEVTTRLDQSAEFVHVLEFGRERVKFSCKRSISDPDVAALILSTIEVDSIIYRDPLVLAREELDTWPIEEPVALFKSFVYKWGETMLQKNHEPTKLVTDRKVISFLHASHYELLSRNFWTLAKVRPILNFILATKSNNLHVLFGYALSLEIGERMKRRAKDNVWF
jgi:hypothetical protein